LTPASLTTRILLLVLLALAPALAIQGYNERALRASRDETVRADTMATARVVADDIAQVAEAVRQSLDLVALAPPVRALDPAGCAAYLRDAVRGKPHLTVITLARPDGTVVCNSVAPVREGRAAPDRAYHARALSERTFVMGTYARGNATGLHSMHFAQPLSDASGATFGVLSAGVDLKWLAGRLVADLRAPSTSLTVTDAGQVIVVRHPDGDSWVGRPLPGERRKYVDAEGVRLDTGIDGHVRILANTHPDGPAAGTWVTVGVDRDVAYADVDAATRRGLALLAAGILVAAGSALLAGRYFIRRPIERLLRTAAAWRSGDLAARTGLEGPDEFGRLGRKLDGMAENLQRNERALQAEVRNGREMQARQVAMLHELNHRVKNTLATVQSLARHSRRSGDAGGRLEERILALSKTHDLLVRDDWSGAPLREVVEAEIGPYRGEPDRFTVAGEPESLAPRLVLALGMTLHELAANAAAHGALSVPDGRVEVAWRTEPRADGPPRLVITWAETGGPAATGHATGGFGTRLIAASVKRELEGSIDTRYGPDGLLCVIELPLAATAPGYLSPAAPSP